jgi:hypothetical protein
MNYFYLSSIKETGASPLDRDRVGDCRFVPPTRRYKSSGTLVGCARLTTKWRKRQWMKTAQKALLAILVVRSKKESARLRAIREHRLRG